MASGRQDAAWQDLVRASDAERPRSDPPVVFVRGTARSRDRARRTLGGPESLEFLGQAASLDLCRFIPALPPGQVPAPYSERSATVGSTLVARSAGRNDVRSDAASNSSGAISSTTGSTAF